MSRVITFEKCWARPSEGEYIHLLSDHLRRVKRFMEQWVVSDPHLQTLMGMAGLCHDLLKAHADWQAYIRNRIPKGPSHAPGGAFFFSCLAFLYLQEERAWEDYKILWLWLTRDVADHHGQLKSLQQNHWIKDYEWNQIDIEGLSHFLKGEYGILISEEALEDWMIEVPDWMEEAQDALNCSYQSPQFLSWMESLQQWRLLTTGLIAGDRFDVKTMNGTVGFLHQQRVSCADHIEAFTERNSHHPLSSVRRQAQHDILTQWQQQSKEWFYTIEMPTGYGKTITSLKLALEMMELHRLDKIVYVAPYLSIIEQTAKVIEEAMGIGVLEHHSLAVINENREESLPPDLLAVESWAHPIICTSFQQWTKAMFPKTAQHTLRRAFLKKCIVIIDEPQIFDPEGWNVFLCGLEALAKVYDIRVLFISATMPPFRFGLSKKPVALSIPSQSTSERYQVILQEPMDEKRLVSLLVRQPESTQAALLNTIEDAYRVYQHIPYDLHPWLVHGNMVPLHKVITIAKIREVLRQDKPTFVISTQVLEAGVDVSFGQVFRAKAILPSLVQAGGRVNRHMEQSKGILNIIPFLRGGEKDTSYSIYEAHLLHLTQRLLEDRKEWKESDMLPLVQRYYEEMFRMNSLEAGKEKIRQAYEGDWPALSAFQPFRKDVDNRPFFIPWAISEEDRTHIPNKITELMNRFQVQTPREIYERYLNRSWMRQLSFEEHKNWMILVHAFTLSIPKKLADTLVPEEQSQDVPIPLLDQDFYDNALGFVRHFQD